MTPLARRLALPVEVSGITAGRLPAPVETTAYLLICEVLQNTVKHAQAAGPGSASCRRMGSSRLRSATTGSAALIRQRAGAAQARRLVEPVGGRLSIESPSSAGTTVRVGAAMRVVIADDALLIREGLTRVLAGCSRRQPLVIWDIRGKNALSALRRLYI